MSPTGPQSHQAGLDASEAMRAGHDTPVARSVMVGRRLVREMRRRGMVARRSWSFGTDAVGREEANSVAPPSLQVAPRRRQKGRRPRIALTF